MNRLTILFAVLLLAELWIAGYADESPGFFLKITKNVPRLGKRGEAFLMKNMKTIPRIGRSNPEASITPLLAWLWNIDADPQFSKRRLPSTGGTGSVEHELSVVQPVNSNTLFELLDRNAIPSEHVKFVHWKDFDRALQADVELYTKIIHLGRDPDQRLKQDLSFNSYIPIFGADDAKSNDFMLYNKNDRDLYGGYDRNFMQYNRL
ncbi:hypothetical protein AWZ03_005847 [Drosophila navojoa]|uniref:Ecdysis triggering hormone n=1 Tax=Drosophila navojoa TaxID=7232 RepID=A0A484BG10_DRONA|nr:uncharacterized protein LOC108654244 [Drosophila navojoa]TDG47703.1 hypothetical protein AWZ03_005847 [Drosophila navojoa]